MSPGTKQLFQNNILLENSFVTKANQIFGFIQNKAVFDMLFLQVKQCDVKVWQKFFIIRQYIEAVACKNFPIPLSFDTYQSQLLNVLLVEWLFQKFDNMCKKFNSIVELISLHILIP